MNALRRHSIALMIATVVVLLTGTAAFAAVRLSTSRPTAADLPVIRTSRPVSIAVTGAPAATSVAAGASSPAARTKASAKRRASAGTSARSPSARPASSKTPARPAPKASERDHDEDEDDHEVVTPPVHESDDEGKDNARDESKSDR